MWTIKRVQTERPQVRVNVGGKVLDGMIVGTRLEHPSVRVGHGAVSQSFEYAWETILRALDDGLTLQT